MSNWPHLHWDTFATLYWVVWVIAFAFWETAGGVDKKHDIPMLTQAVVRYANPAYNAWLRNQ